MLQDSFLEQSTGFTRPFRSPSWLTLRGYRRGGAWGNEWRTRAAARRTDTLVATASSPFHNADTAFTVIDSGRVDNLVS